MHGTPVQEDDTPSLDRRGNRLARVEKLSRDLANPSSRIDVAMREGESHPEPLRLHAGVCCFVWWVIGGHLLRGAASAFA